MIALMICLLVNVLILIIFRLFPTYKIHNLRAIVFNYFICVTTASILLGQIPFSMEVTTKPWFPYGVIMGIMFISIFNIVALSLQKIGIVVSTVFHKMSLIFPVVLGFLFFAENITVLRWGGILMAIISIFIVNYPSSDDDYAANLKKYWYLPLIIWFGSGMLEFLLYYVSKIGAAKGADISFVSFSFFIAGIIGILYLFITKQIKFQKQDILGGLILGIPNFFSIYLMFKVLEEGIDASIVFPFINVGVILFGALVGALLFKEKLTFMKIIGIGSAIIAIILLIQS